MAKGKKKRRKKTTAAEKPADSEAKPMVVAESKPVKKRKTVPQVSFKERVLGTVNTVSQFLREVRAELAKVTWPTRKDTIASTSVVLVIVLLIAAFLGIVDLGLSKLMRFLLS
jgi:preprotein translocase subunit SecE